uniref:U20-Eretoxin-Ek1a_1 n=1 Tax=Eresus cinnaberinus TaxID=175337 RepID=A0A2D0PCP0_ERECI
MNIHLIVVVVLLLAVEAVRPDSLEDAGLLPEERGRSCAQPHETCSKGRRGQGPRECCPPKGCSCNPFTSYCDCSWDAWF